MLIPFPHSVDHQMLTNMANSAKNQAQTVRNYGASRTQMDDWFALRVHELMRHRSHNVQDW